MPTQTKKPWLSKTLWLNLVMAITPFFPAAAGWVAAHPETFMAGFAIVNVFLRLFTKDQISLQD